MASVFDVARYILEQKGDLPNPVIQELCRLTLRDGIFIREPLLFREKYELVISDTYPKGEICIDLYNECPDLTVSAEKIINGDSSRLTVNEKLIINETLNKCFDAVRMHFQNVLIQQEEIQQEDNSAEDPFITDGVPEECDEQIMAEYQAEQDDYGQEEGQSEAAVYQNASEESYEYAAEENSETEIDEMNDTVQFSTSLINQESYPADSDEEMQENADPFISTDMNTSTVYAQNTVVMNDAVHYNTPAEGFDDTEPLNYTYQPKPHKRTAENRQRTAVQQPQHPVKRAPARNSDRSFFICVLTVMIILLVIIAVFILSEKKKAKEKENLSPVFTKSETIPPEPEPEEEPEAEETEPEEVTEVPETSETLETTEPVTEVTTVVSTTEPEPVTVVTVTEAPPRVLWDHSDGRNVLEEIDYIDIDRDGVPDALEVYNYNSDDIYYQIKYSDGRDITYAFPNHNEDRTWDYIVYDKNTDSIYPAGLKDNFNFFDNSGIKLIKINGPEVFSIENSITFNGVQKNCSINNQKATSDEVLQYFNNIEILYSYNDKEKIMISSLVSTEAGWSFDFSW